MALASLCILHVPRTCVARSNCLRVCCACRRWADCRYSYQKTRRLWSTARAKACNRFWNHRVRFVPALCDSIAGDVRGHQSSLCERGNGVCAILSGVLSRDRSRSNERLRRSCSNFAFPDCKRCRNRISHPRELDVGGGTRSSSCSHCVFSSGTRAFILATFLPSPSSARNSRESHSC